jgi:hypothetical protein
MGTPSQVHGHTQPGAWALPVRCAGKPSQVHGHSQSGARALPGRIADKTRGDSRKTRGENDFPHRFWRFPTPKRQNPARLGRFSDPRGLDRRSDRIGSAGAPRLRGGGEGGRPRHGIEEIRESGAGESCAGIQHGLRGFLNGGRPAPPSRLGARGSCRRRGPLDIGSHSFGDRRPAASEPWARKMRGFRDGIRRNVQDVAGEGLPPSSFSIRFLMALSARARR